MIATRPDAATLRRYRRNLRRCLDTATPDQWARGVTWYQTAHDLARALAGDGCVSSAAGCIAALSAQKSWPRNVKLATDALAGTPNGHTADTLTKVRRILAGETPETVLPMDLKTGHFFRCIADPGDADAVVIDRHTHDVIVGERYGQRNRGLSNRTRYAALAGVVRDVARQRGILASHAQAIGWLVQLEATGANSDA
jgi:hypothetical protein